MQSLERSSIDREKILNRRNVNVFTPQNIYEAYTVGRGTSYKPKSVNIGKELEEAAAEVAKSHNLEGVSHLLRLALLSIPEIKASYDSKVNPITNSSTTDN